MFHILLKKQMTEIFRAYFYDAKKNKKRSVFSTVLFFGFFIILMVGIVGGMFAYLADSLCKPFAMVNMKWLYFLIMGMIAIALGTFGSVFNTYSGLYLSKDNDLLLSMPIPIRSILTIRLASVYLMGFMYSAIVMLPAEHPEGIPLTSTMYSRIYGNEAPGVLIKGGKTGFTNEAGSCLVSYAVTNKGNAYVFCTGGATYRWAPVYDEIYVYKNIIPASAKDLETETTKMSPNN